jgi:serine/threonine protein phosphatase PrpC
MAGVATLAVYEVSTHGKAIIPARMTLAAHGVTHTGRRKINEDSMLVDLPRGLFVVADGMGGHNAGEVASAIAVRAIHDCLKDAPTVSGGTLADGIELANTEVLKAAATEPDYAGMGTTVVAVVLTGRRALFASVGDSRLYHWRGGTLTQVTRDDSWVARVLPREALTPEEAQRHPMRHVLTKVVGLRDDLDPVVGERELEAGDVLMLCSDGLHGSVTDAAIARTIGDDPQVNAVAAHLVDQALDGGATDNITVIVIRVQ